MATTTRVCFSFAAYAKNVINHLKASNVPVENGLNDVEFTAIESKFNFTFPPDLRSILREGLPVGPGFPNWRSSSPQQLEIVTNLPILGLCKEVSRDKFWAEDWGPRPKDVEIAVKIARLFLKKSPVLVPIYRRFYIPSSPILAGNPIFCVDGGDVTLSSFDVAGFFQTVELRSAAVPSLLHAPAWAATEARRIEFWTEMVERREGERLAAAREDTRGWWGGDLGLCLEEVFWRLRDGGWKEEEVREMMMMDGGDEFEFDQNNNNNNKKAVMRDEEEEEEEEERLVCHVGVLSLRLLRAGWSTEDVVDSLGCQVEIGGGVPNPDGGESWFDFQHTIISSPLEAC